MICAFDRGRDEPDDRAKHPADEHKEDGKRDPGELVQAEGADDLDAPAIDLERRHRIDHEGARPESRHHGTTIVLPQAERAPPGPVRRGLSALQQARAAEHAGGLELDRTGREAWCVQRVAPARAIAEQASSAAQASNTLGWCGRLAAEDVSRAATRT